MGGAYKVKKEVPLVIAFTMGLSVVLAMFFKDVSWLTAWKVTLDDWFQIISAWAVMVGVVNLVQVHSKQVSGKRPGCAKSVFLMICMFVMMFFGLFISKNSNHEGWQWAYRNILSPMNATVYSTFGVFTASAAYRTFRWRNLEAGVLMIAAVAMMIGRVPLGSLLFGSGVASLADWLQNIPTAAAMRGLQMGAVIGGIVTALRMMIGLERGYLSGGE